MPAAVVICSQMWYIIITDEETVYEEAENIS